MSWQHDRTGVIKKCRQLPSDTKERTYLKDSVIIPYSTVMLSPVIQNEPREAWEAWE